jgi:hypothetical protein
MRGRIAIALHKPRRTIDTTLLPLGASYLPVVALTHVFESLLGASGAEKLRALGALGRGCPAPQLHR